MASDLSFDSVEPVPMIIIYGSKGRKAEIDLSGDEVTYSGDLPVAESAKVFFDSVFYAYKQYLKEKETNDD